MLLRMPLKISGGDCKALTGFRESATDLFIEVCMGESLSHAVLKGFHSQLLQVHPGAHVVANAILQDVPHCQHLHALP